MGIFKRHRKGGDEASDLPVKTEEPQALEISIEPVSPDDLARCEAEYRVVPVSTPAKAAVALDALVPVASNAAQAAGEYGMAIVRFPEGVGWADLCNRHSGVEDGWKLLSNIKDGEFNELAAIRQAGLTPVGVANIALWVGAAAVGMAYMNQINSQLKALQEGVGEISRTLDLERQAKLKTAFDSLAGLAAR